MQSELLKLIENFDVISFDIFDTLLIRNVLNPKDVWRILEQKEYAQGFFAERDAADVATYAAATRRGGEHALDEAYAMMGTRWAEFSAFWKVSRELSLYARWDNDSGCQSDADS